MRRETTVSLSKEDRLLKKKRIIRRFRALVRLVIANLFWIGDPGDAKISDNVKRNIRLLMRRKKVKSLLPIREKAILNKPHEYRTEEEKMLLIRNISGLRCFSRFPLEVKQQLATLAYFSYFPPGRIIIKQGQLPTAMYFIMLGECIVTITNFSKILDEYVTHSVGTLHTGMMFGDVALLYGVERAATITTATHCEFLIIKQEDFDVVLRDTLEKSWASIQDTLNQFSYFKNWDAVVKKECCMFAKKKHYAAGDIVFGDGVGVKNYVYFIIKGSCHLIEDIKVRVYTKNGLKSYCLDAESETSMELPLRHKSVGSIFRKYWLDEDVISVYSRKRSSVVESLQNPQAVTDWKATMDLPIFHESSYVTFIQSKSKKMMEIPPAPETSPYNSDESDDGNEAGKNRTIINTTLSADTNRDFIIFGGKEYKLMEKYKLETHFMKICEMSTGACFNVGEKFTNRRLEALTPVTCLLVPQHFIFRNNVDNMWGMVKQFLEGHIPDTKKIFKMFLRQMKFKNYRKSLVTQLLEEKRVPTDNSIHNVPYSIRLTEGVDVNYF